MNEDDLHDILEKINEKELAKTGMRELAENLGAFREGLLLEGFNEAESLALVLAFMTTTLSNVNK